MSKQCPKGEASGHLRTEEGVGHVHTAELSEDVIKGLDCLVVVPFDELALGLLHELKHLSNDTRARDRVSNDRRARDRVSNDTRARDRVSNDTRARLHAV